MSNVVELKRPSPLPPDLPATLRKMADDVESGNITDMAIVCVHDDNYRFVWPSSINDTIVMCTLALNSAIDRMRR